MLDPQPLALHAVTSALWTRTYARARPTSRCVDSLDRIMTKRQVPPADDPWLELPPRARVRLNLWVGPTAGMVGDRATEASHHRRLRAVPGPTDVIVIGPGGNGPAAGVQSRRLGSRVDRFPSARAPRAKPHAANSKEDHDSPTLDRSRRGLP